MSIQQPSPEWEDTIDLRKWIDALFRYKWLILACTVIAVAVATIFSYVIQTPTFKATGGASLPAANADGGLGLTLRGYQEFAASTPVMDAVSQKLGLQPDAGRLRAGYTFQLEKDEGFITVTASAETAEQAFQLASRWIEAYDEQVQAKIREQFNSLRDEANSQLEILTPELTLAEDGLARFNLENQITTLEARISTLEAELSGSEGRLRELTRSSIPDQEARLASLRSGLGLELGAVGGGGSPVGVSPTVNSADEAEPGNVTSTNLVYLELSQGLIRARFSPLEQELVGSESRLRQLTWSSIPIDEARLVALQDALNAEPETLNITPIPEDTPQGSPPNGGLSLNTTIPNPIYLQLRHELLDARDRLTAKQAEAEILTTRIPILEIKVEILRKELVTSQEYTEELTKKLEAGRELEQLIEDLAAGQKEALALAAGVPSLKKEVKVLRQQLAKAKKIRSELGREATRLRAAYEPAMAELDRLLEIEPRLATLAGLSTIREPALPTKPVAPQRTRNISLAAVLGLMLGVFGAFFLEYYRSTAPAARPNEE